MVFDIRNHIDLDPQGRAICPSCALDGKTRKKNLSVDLEKGGYKCHRGCTTDDIRDVLGFPKAKTVPAQLAKTTNSSVSPQKIKADQQKLMASDGPAKQWLHDRGIPDTLITHHKLGISQARIGNKRCWSISIPIPNHDGTKYWQKKRVAPWDRELTEDKNYQPWKQFGIPQLVYFTHQPKDANTTWLTEGEWDAIKLGELVRVAKLPIAVATFTCGASNIPPVEELDKLPGTVFIWYDRNDKPLKNGDRPGEKGARKLASFLGNRGLIADVPMPEACEVQGWDVSDAIAQGYTIDEFVLAASEAKPYTPTDAEKPQSDNPLKARLKWNDDLVANAPDYTEFLVPDLLTEDELFLLAAGPRTGKSLFAMTLY